MSDRTKKILIIAVIIIAVVAVGFLLWSLFRGPTVPAPTQPGVPVTRAPIGTLPPSGERVIVPPVTTRGVPVPPAPTGPGASAVASGGATLVTVLSEDEAFRPIISAGGAVRYYAPRDGKFYEVKTDKTKRELTPALFPKAEQIIWDGAGDSAVITFPDGAKVFYDFSAKRQISLPAPWHDFSFSPDGSQLVFKTDHPNPDKRWLIAAAPDGSQVRAIEPLGANGDHVTPLWSPTNEVAALFTKPVTFNRQEVYFLGFNRENYKTMLVEGAGFRPTWSPRGDRLLYSIYPNDDLLKPQLWIADARGEDIGKNRTYLRVETWADKCVFAGDGVSVYCAVPRGLPVGSGPYPVLAAGVPDDFYKIDTTTGIRTLLAVPSPQQIRAETISLAVDQSSLVFRDAFTGKAMEIKLK